MTTEEQMRIINNWTYSAQISYSRHTDSWFGRLSIIGETTHHVGPYRTEEQVVGTCYHLVQSYVWNNMEQCGE